MAQFARPSSDIATNGWTSTPLYDQINEVSYSDADYIENNAVSYCEVALGSLSDPNSDAGHYIRYRLGRSRTDRTLTIVVRLMQGASEIASWTHVDPGLSFQPFEQTLTSGEADSITDYTDLRLRFDITTLQNSQVSGQVSWAEMEVPTAGTVARDSVPAYVKGLSTDKTQHAAYVRGSSNATPSSVSAFIAGQALLSDNISAYVAGLDVAKTSKSAYVEGTSGGGAPVSDSTPAFVKGQATVLDSTPAYVAGAVGVSTSVHGFVKGASQINTSVHAFVLGLDTIYAPDSDVDKAGTWKDQSEGTTDLYQAIDEHPLPNDGDYIYLDSPQTGNYIEVGLENASAGSGDTVIFWRGRDESGSSSTKVTAQLREGSTVIASQDQVLSSIFTTYYLALTPAEKASITDWTNLRVRFIFTQV